MAEPAPKRLLLVGGGHAHLRLLERLATERPAGWQIALVTPYPRLLYSGMLPGWIAGRHAIEALSIPLARLAARAGVEFHETTLVELSPDAGVVVCADGQRLSFDLVSIDTGPEPASANLAGAREHSLAIRPIEHFVAHWPGVVQRWRANRTPFEIAVVGAGPAAVEIAFAIRRRAERDAADRVHVHLVGDSARPMPAAAARAQRIGLAQLAARGISWHGASTVQQIDARGLTLSSGPSIPFDACIVATGAAAPRWPREAGLAVDAEGFIRVDETLRSVSHPRVFAAGDVAALAQPRPKSGVFAVRGGDALAANLLAECAGRATQPWQPQTQALYLVSTSDGCAIAARGRWSAAGRCVGWLKDRIDQRFVRRYGGAGEGRASPSGRRRRF